MNQSQQIGPYTLQSSLGHGGMADVYLAWDRANRWPAALKVLRGGAGKDGRLQKRFEREAAALMKLRHPHIVQIYSAGRTTDGRPYIAMEYIGGGDLEALIARTAGGRLPIHQAVYLMRRVAGAVAYAHEQGIVHRDLKPSNILLRADTGEPVVADLGIASLAGAKPLTGTMESLGTPQYMAPEQASSGAMVDARADVYAIGVMLHELLTGHTPFEPDTGWALLARKQQEAAPSILTLRRDLNPHLAALVDACLMRDPGARYQTAAALAVALDAFLPADAGPPPPLPVKHRGTPTPRTPSTPGTGTGDRRLSPLLLAGGAALALLLALALIIQALNRDGEQTGADNSSPTTRTETPEGVGSEEMAVEPGQPTSTLAAVDNDSTPSVVPSRTRPPTGATAMGRVTRDVYTRDGPGLNYPIAGDLGGGQVVTVLGRDGRGDWFLVESPSGPVWVSKGYLDEASGSLTAVEMAATIPAQPTATPTTATTLVGDVTPVSLPEIGLLEPRPAACPPGANAPAYAADDTLAFRWTWPDDPPEGGYLEVRAGPVGRIVSQGRVDPAAHRQGDTWTFPVSGSTLFNPGDGAYQWAVYVIDGTGRPAMNSALSCFGLVGSGQPGPEQPPGSADSDGDGVPDSGDICPGQPAGNNPDPDYPGCPVPPPAVDSDGDGIVDSNDECPFDRPGPYPDPNRPGCPGSYP